jgi:diaminohydroxyphosphoribosylaminopyrimidine deaminase / 5-amino-6-(5-phosphoribosylamino)uracil reductase
MQRCLDLAALGAGFTAPNPMVGAVLVHQGRIVAEGWHRQYGQAHAEVNCFDSVAPADQSLIPESTLYCSLEPCFHFGKTPPCVERVLQERVRRVVIASLDPNPLVAGQSVQKMRAAGVEVTVGVLEEEARRLNRVFFHWVTQRSPYIVLKWAESADGFVGKSGERVPVSGNSVRRLVHRWRTELQAIVVGAETAFTDNPLLDNRLYPGRQPLRIAFDGRGRVPASHHLLDDSCPTWILGPEREGSWKQTRFYPDINLRTPRGLSHLLASEGISSTLIEGGSALLQSFIDAGLFQEIRCIRNRNPIGVGIPAPVLPNGLLALEEQNINQDLIRIFSRKKTEFPV